MTQRHVTANLWWESRCPAFGYTTPPAGTPLALGASQTPTYARLTFGARVSYDAALLVVSNLGLRLADPCREQAMASGQGSAWQPAGQESAYATSHALMLASSPLASSQWQARALPGVTDVEMSPASSCS